MIWVGTCTCEYYDIQLGYPVAHFITYMSHNTHAYPYSLAPPYFNCCSNYRVQSRALGTLVLSFCYAVVNVMPHLPHLGITGGMVGICDQLPIPQGQVNFSNALPFPYLIG